MELITHFFSQTLNTLNLTSNQIGSQGAKHLANALEHNSVIGTPPLFFSFNYSLTIILQMLITLHLAVNQIGAQGTEHLANALKHNNVAQLSPQFLLLKYSLTIFYRHSPHLTCP